VASPLVSAERSPRRPTLSPQRLWEPLAALRPGPKRWPEPEPGQPVRVPRPERGQPEWVAELERAKDCALALSPEELPAPNRRWSYRHRAAEPARL